MAPARRGRASAPPLALLVALLLGPAGRPAQAQAPAQAPAQGQAVDPSSPALAPLWAAARSAVLATQPDGTGASPTPSASKRPPRAAPKGPCPTRPPPPPPPPPPFPPALTMPAWVPGLGDYLSALQAARAALVAAAGSAQAAYSMQPSGASGPCPKGASYQLCTRKPCVGACSGPYEVCGARRGAGGKGERCTTAPCQGPLHGESLEPVVSPATTPPRARPSPP
jgi:hypothetical protein